MPVFVGMLVLATSMAVAAVSWWLVVPYLALMAFLLSEPAGRRVSATNPAGPGSATPGASALAVTPDPTGADADGGRPSPPGDSLAPPDAPAPPKARRAGSGRGKGAKKARPVVEPAPATWVQVAPGKFVRVEAGATPAEAGPHPSLPPGTTPPTPLAAEAGSVPTPGSRPGPLDAPQEAALDDPHLEPTPPEGPAPDGPRDTETALAGPPRDDVAHADPSASDPGERSGSEPRPDLDASRVEPVGPGPVDVPEPLATDAPDPDPAAGPQPEAPRSGDVVAEARSDATDAEPVLRDGPGADHPAACDGPAPDHPADEGADSAGPQPEADAPFSLVAATIEAGPETACDLADAGPEGAPGDSSHGRTPETAGTSSLRGSVARRVAHGVPPSPRNVRPPHAPRRPNGLRLRSSRGDGRPHHFARTFPPRSPPRCGTGPRVKPTRPPRAGRAPSTGARPALAFGAYSCGPITPGWPGQRTVRVAELREDEARPS